MATNLLLLNGPNLNLLGSREPLVYGATTLAEVERAAKAQAEAAGAKLDSFQSNHEGDLIDRIHAAREAGVNAIIINPGGLTHTSVSLRDALAAWLKSKGRGYRKQLGWLLNKKFEGKTLKGRVPARPIVGITPQTIEDVREAVAVKIMEAK